MAVPKVPPPSAVGQLAQVLDSPEIARLVSELEAPRWTARPGYPIRTMVGMALAKSLYAVPTWTRTVRLVSEHAALRLAIYEWRGRAVRVRLLPLHRKAAPVRRPAASVHRSCRRRRRHSGEHVAIDASDMPAYANGQRFVSKGGRERAESEFSDPDDVGHRSAVSTRKGGGFYGYKLHMAVDTATDLPLAWSVRTASANESTMVAPLLDKLRACGIQPGTVTMDKGYDVERVYHRDGRARCGADHPAARDARRQARRPQAADVRARRVDVRRSRPQPAGEQVALPDRRVHPGVAVGQGRLAAPADPARVGALYKQRGAVEREFGRLKHDWALAPLRVRRIERVRLHADLTILTKLACALARARAVPVAA